jgi:integrase
VIIFAIETGMRRGKVLSLCWDNVHLGKRHVHLLDTKNGASREVPLSPQALELLRELPRNIGSDQDVFPLHFEALKSSWRRACCSAGIIDLRFHDLRHEATSKFFEKGLNVMEVAAITGHKDPRMLQRYTHLRAEKLALKLKLTAR